MKSIFEEFERRSTALPYRQAVAVIVLNSEGKFFMGKANGLYNIWKIPQGGIEPGETYEEAAFRELYEESGLTGKITNVSDNKYSCDYPEGSRYMPGFQGQEFRWFLFRVDGSDHVNLTGNNPTNENVEFSDHKWVTAQEAIELAHNDFGGDPVTYQRQTMYRKILAEFGLLKKDHSQKPTNKKSNGPPIQRT